MEHQIGGIKISQEKEMCVWIYQHLDRVAVFPNRLTALILALLSYCTPEQVEQIVNEVKTGQCKN